MAERFPRSQRLRRFRRFLERSFRRARPSAESRPPRSHVAQSSGSSSSVRRSSVRLVKPRGTTTRERERGLYIDTPRGFHIPYGHSSLATTLAYGEDTVDLEALSVMQLGIGSGRPPSPFPPSTATLAAPRRVLLCCSDHDSTCTLVLSVLVRRRSRWTALASRSFVGGTREARQRRGRGFGSGLPRGRNGRRIVQRRFALAPSDADAIHPPARRCHPSTDFSRSHEARTIRRGVRNGRSFRRFNAAVRALRRFHHRLRVTSCWRSACGRSRARCSPGG